MNIPLIISEAGITHGGSVETAFDLCEAAKSTGADIVKFQTYQTDKLLHRSDPNYDQLKKLELPFDAFKKIAAHCDAIGIEFCSTPGDVECLEFLVRECGVKRVKIGSDDLTNRPLVDAAYSTGLPLIISTGMATREEIYDAIEPRIPELRDRIVRRLHNDITIMHCVSLYPCPVELVNLRAIQTMQEEFERIGYSDHSSGIIACIVAATFGAVVIEKHLCLGGYTGPDDLVSATPWEFDTMVRRIAEAMKMLGDGRKEPGEQERKAAALLRKGKDGLRPIGPGKLYEDFGAHTS